MGPMHADAQEAPVGGRHRHARPSRDEAIATSLSRTVSMGPGHPGGRNPLT
jgi:hypothetical protein